MHKIRKSSKEFRIEVLVNFEKNINNAYISRWILVSDIGTRKRAILVNYKVINRTGTLHTIKFYKVNWFQPWTEPVHR